MIKEETTFDSNTAKGLLKSSGGEKNKYRHEEYQYLDAIADLISMSKKSKNRTGIDTLAKHGLMMKFDNSNGTLPLITTKKTAFLIIVKELLFFIKGQTDGKILLDQGCNIWKANGSKEFLESRGIMDRKEHDLGPIYGFQWRHFGANYTNCDADYTGQGVDQFADVIERIKKDPTDRRLIVSAWNPTAIPKMALPPCHCFFQFFVEDDQLDCLMYQRSCDMGLGVPFNIASYSILLHIVAKLTNLKARTFIHSLGNYHIYENHIEPLKTQLSREPHPFPKLTIKDRGQSKLEDFVLDDFELVGYQSHDRIKMDMAV